MRGDSDMGRPFLIALQFLTRLPVRLSGDITECDTGRSLLWYPLVGLIIGLLLAAINWAIASAPDLLRAGVLLAAWVLITGALHLDGLADSADAWLGGPGDRERTLAIMKDPYCGPAAVVILVVVLILKFAALTVLVQRNDWASLIVIPLLARAYLPLLFLTTPYVRRGGLGTALAEHASRGPTILVLIVTVAAILLMTGKSGLLPLAVATLVFVLLRVVMLQRIGGTTGDTAGALVELVETVALASAQI